MFLHRSLRSHQSSLTRLSIRTRALVRCIPRRRRQGLRREGRRLGGRPARMTNVTPGIWPELQERLSVDRSLENDEYDLSRPIWNAALVDGRSDSFSIRVLTAGRDRQGLLAIGGLTGTRFTMSAGAAHIGRRRAPFVFGALRATPRLSGVRSGWHRAWPALAGTMRTAIYRARGPARRGRRHDRDRRCERHEERFIAGRRLGASHLRLPRHEGIVDVIHRAASPRSRRLDLTGLERLVSFHELRLEREIVVHVHDDGASPAPRSSSDFS